MNNCRLNFQLHITQKCNQRCKHCYHNDYDGENLSLNDIEEIIEQYKELLVAYNKAKNINYRGHINITGGEPFVRKDIFEIIDLLYKNRKYFSYGILTNGTLITDEIVSILKNKNVAFIQVSIDGNRKTHDDIRGDGNLKKVFQTLKLLKKNKIKTMVSFTAHKANYKEFPTVANYCRLLGVYKLWTDRLVPFGNGESIKKFMLTEKEIWDYISIIQNEKNKSFLNKLTGLTIADNRALQFLNTGSECYSCSAGDSLITVLDNGDIVPCRRMPIIRGNIKKDKMIDVFFNDTIFIDLKKDNIPNECKNCRHANKCRGGSKCIAYALTNSYNRADNACSLRENK